MKFEPYFNDLLDPEIKNFEDLTNHFDLVERLQKSFYFKLDYCSEDEILTNASLPLTEISVKLFEKALEELNSDVICQKTDAYRTDCVVSGKLKKFNKLNLKYVSNILRKAFISPYCFILALIYIRRLKKINPAYVKQQSACDLFLISLIVSSKFLHEEATDEEIFNVEWSTISGIDIKTLNQMEIEFLFKLDWRAYVGPMEFMEEWIKIENLVIKNECMKRSYQFITYTEIMRIFENDKVYQRLVSNFLNWISKFILIASFAYSSIVIALILLSKSTMLDHNDTSLSNHMNQNHDTSSELINQTSYSNRISSSFNHDSLKSDDRNQDSNEDHQILNEQTMINSDIVENLQLNSKTLNFNKLNNLDLSELNNRFDILSRLQIEDSIIATLDLTLDLHNVRQSQISSKLTRSTISDQQSCEQTNNFNQLVKTLINLGIMRNDENHSDFDRSRIQAPNSNIPNQDYSPNRRFFELKVY